MSELKRSRSTVRSQSDQLRGISSTMTDSSKKITSRVQIRRKSFGYGGVPGVGRVAERSSGVKLLLYYLLYY